MPTFINDDLSLFYNEKGSGQILLILPGNKASSACHDEELGHFGQYCHTVFLDFRGTGKSQRLSAWPDNWWDKCADDTAVLIAHLGEQHCIVMGTSVLFSLSGSLKDSFIPDIGKQNIRMAKQIQSSNTFLSNDGDHPFMWTCPDVFRSVSYQFLKNWSER